MAISKKIRFEVFKRDGFACAYCGKTPPTVTLEVDHIDPKSKGGKDDINNLITACFDCNRGKKAIPLTKIPNRLSENLEILKEQEEQIKEYRKFLKKIDARINKDMDAIDAIYTKAYPGWILSDSFRHGSLKNFLNKLPFTEVKNAMEIATSRISKDKDKVIQYFCGICWNKIKALTDPNHELKRELVRYWQSKPRGSGYLAPGCLDKWLNKYSGEQIRFAMDKANGVWNELRYILEDD